MNSKSNKGKRFPTFSKQETIDSPHPPTVKPDIEGYKIEGQLGEGGMGTVWRAVQISTNREVALKVTNAQVFGSKRALVRFEREVELAARLEHPNIARVYDSGIHQKVYYYAMELVKGLALDDYVKVKRLEQRQIVNLMQTIISAIHYAHQRGIIHRDLKPSNILVTDDGQPHILDFGLAKDLLQDQKDHTVSLDGDILGTPAFMSPEQASGKLDIVDTRSDIYSIGVIFYLLLTHQWPYDIDGSHYEVLEIIQKEIPKRPRIVTPTIDRDLEAILMKSLEKVPDLRYQAMTELIEDIVDWLQGFPVKARSVSQWYLLKKYIFRHRIASVIIALLVTILLSTGFIGYYSLRQAHNIRSEQEREKEKHLKELMLQQNVNEAIANQLFTKLWLYEDFDEAFTLCRFLPGREKERAGVTFLLDLRPLDEKKTELSPDVWSQQPAFWHFIIGEHYFQDGHSEAAIKSYQQCLDINQDRKAWFTQIASMRLSKLLNSK